MVPVQPFGRRFWAQSWQTGRASQQIELPTPVSAVSTEPPATVKQVHVDRTELSGLAVSIMAMTSICRIATFERHCAPNTQPVAHSAQRLRPGVADDVLHDVASHDQQVGFRPADRCGVTMHPSDAAATGPVPRDIERRP
jgi:hypothetical protein